MTTSAEPNDPALPALEWSKGTHPGGGHYYKAETHPSLSTGWVVTARGETWAGFGSAYNDLKSHKPVNDVHDGKLAIQYHVQRLWDAQCAKLPTLAKAEAAALQRLSDDIAQSGVHGWSVGEWLPTWWGLGQCCLLKDVHDARFCLSGILREDRPSDFTQDWWEPWGNHLWVSWSVTADPWLSGDFSTFGIRGGSPRVDHLQAVAVAEEFIEKYANIAKRRKVS